MRPTRDEVLMQFARVAAVRGTCSKLHVGAVASREGRVLVTGYNGTPAGMDHCQHVCTCGNRHMDMPQVQYRGRVHDPRCGLVAPCEVTVHAEENCVAYAARHGISLLGAEIHSTDSPCLFCARLIINAGIVRLVFERLYRITEGLTLLETAGVQTEQFAGRTLV